LFGSNFSKNAKSFGYDKKLRLEIPKHVTTKLSKSQKLFLLLMTS